MSKITALCLLLVVSSSTLGRTRQYRKATEGRAVVMRKLYPKKKKVEFAFNFGALLNQSYINTFMFNSGLSYHFSEHWGMLIEGSFGLNMDKDDRFCLEHFLNRSENGEALANREHCFYHPDALEEHKNEMRKHSDFINFGPAYVSIVQIEQTAMAGAIWTPIYGKQIFTFLPRTSHMDFYISGVAGVAIGSYFRERKKLANNNTSRFSSEKKVKVIPKEVGANVDDVKSYGELGRPDAQKFYSPAVSIGIGQKYHLAHWLFLRFEARNYAVFIVHDVLYRSVFAIRGGLGIIL